MNIQEKLKNIINPLDGLVMGYSDVDAIEKIVKAMPYGADVKNPKQEYAAGVAPTPKRRAASSYYGGRRRRRY